MLMNNPLSCASIENSLPNWKKMHKLCLYVKRLVYDPQLKACYVHFKKRQIQMNGFCSVHLSAWENREDDRCCQLSFPPSYLVVFLLWSRYHTLYMLSTATESFYVAQTGACVKSRSQYSISSAINLLVTEMCLIAVTSGYCM